MTPRCQGWTPGIPGPLPGRPVRWRRSVPICDAGLGLSEPGLLGFDWDQIMHPFLRNSFSLPKLRQLYFKAAFSNFIGFVAGSTVTILTTYETLERRGIKNLFGILPRETVVVHRLP